MYRGWKLTEKSRETLLERFPPRYSRVVAHHITLDLTGTLPPNVSARVIGYSTDQLGLEALVVEVDGSEKRPDDRTYHITWSLESNYRPVDSNKIISLYGYQPVEPVEIEVVPFWVDNDKIEYFKA